MTNQLPSITTKQQAILKLIYRYRFLNRIHIQNVLGHKDKRRIISWLKDLRDKQYVNWQYDATNFIAKGQPAIYYLSLNGIRYLRETGNYSSEELRKRYKEPGRTQAFIDACLLIADCCVVLQAKNTNKRRYSWMLRADYVDLGSEYGFLNELKPHLYFVKNDGDQAMQYLLEVFKPLMPRYAMRKRIKEYVAYLSDGDWQGNVEAAVPPIILIACPTIADFMYCKRRAKQAMEDTDLSEDEYGRIRFATIEHIKRLGVTAKTWEEA